MKKLLFSLMAIALFSLNANANETKENTSNVCDSSVTNPTVRPVIVIGVEWGRASRGCNGNGICIIITTREQSFYQLTTTDSGSLVFKTDARGLESVRSRFGSNTIIVEEAYKLSADVTKELGLPADYTIRAGRYTLVADGTGGFAATM